MASITITGTGMYYGELNYWFRIRDAFDDVTNKDYFYNAVTWAVNHDPQITKGTSDTTFSPSDTCTRGQAVTFLWRACGCEKVTDVENPFTDVKSSDYFYDAVLWAYKNKITTGTTATTFGPNETCNRGQIVTFLWRSQGEPKSDASIAFNDVADEAYYYAPVRWALEKGITKGTTDKTFSPNDSCTRGQIVTFLYRADQAGNNSGPSMLQMKIGDTAVNVEWEENDSVRALKELCKETPLSIQMSMYGGFEQVGSIGASLPRNDQQTTTGAGDIVLYSGNQIVVFYGSNSWAYMRLGHIIDQDTEGMTRLLGNGNVTITISMEPANTAGKR